MPTPTTRKLTLNKETVARLLSPAGAVTIADQTIGAEMTSCGEPCCGGDTY